MIEDVSPVTLDSVYEFYFAFYDLDDSADFATRWDNRVALSYIPGVVVSEPSHGDLAYSQFALNLGVINVLSYFIQPAAVPIPGAI